MIKISTYGSTELFPNNTQVNASSDQLFTWNHNYTLTDTQSHYHLKIYKNIDNSLVYDSTKLASSNEYHTVPSGTLTNSNIYKWQVITYSSLLSAKSQWILFFANSPATLTLGVLPTDLQQYNFQCVYTQSQNVPLRTYEALLFSSDDLVNPIDESGIIYPTTLVENGDTISYLFDGMESPDDYAIQFKGITQHDEAIETAITPFSILYAYPDAIPSLIMTPDNNNATISIDWAAFKQILGYVNGISSYVSGKFGYGLQINANSNLYYNTETIPIDSSVYYWLKITSGYNGILVKFSDDINDDLGMQVTFHTDRFGFDFGDYSTVGRQLTNTELAEIYNNFILIGIQHGKVVIKSNTFQEIISMT